MSNFEQIQENDIVKIIIEDDPGNYFFVKKIEFDKHDECGLWWAVTFELINTPSVSFTWRIDDNHISQVPFSIQGKNIQIVLFARPSMLFEKKEEVNPMEVSKENISLF
jgi:hypothetical protein